MIDSHDPLPPDLLDELASAHLDGQTTDAEAARIAADPALLARVAELEDVRAAARADDAPVDGVRRDASIAAALAAFDEAAAHDTLVSPGVDGSGMLTPITAVSARRGVSRRTLRLVGAAAVAVAVALAVPLIGRLDSDPSGDDLAAKVQEEAAPDGSERTAAADSAAGGAVESGVPAPSTFASPAAAPLDLGTFADLAALEEAVRAQVPITRAADAGSTTAPTGSSAEPDGTCTETREASPPGAGSRVLSGTAILENRRVFVLVYERPTGERTLVVVDADDCTVTQTRRL